jgi:Predicted glycosyltransferases
MEGGGPAGAATDRWPGLAVIIVAYRSADVLEACLASLFTADAPPERIVLCDNASPDDSAGLARRAAEAAGWTVAEARPGEAPPAARLVILRLGANRGYAGAINPALAMLAADCGIDLFWVLNPDCVVAPGAPSAFRRAAAASPAFALMGGRIRYLEPPGLIQSDGGVVSRWTGLCRNLNQRLRPEEAVFPDAARLDFISGASMVASRAFLEAAGPMPEDYFLYYEEVDWAARRGDLPLLLVPDALVYHHGGTAIGSRTPGRRGSPMSEWFNNRNRLRFVRRHRPAALPLALLYSLARAARLFLAGDGPAAGAAVRGLIGLPPPAEVAARLPPEAWGRRPAQAAHASRR